MDGLGYARCVECDAEGIFRDGITCARCLSLVYLPFEEEEEDEQELLKTISFEPFVEV